MATAEGARTRAKSKSETCEVANAVKAEVRSYLLFPEFKGIVSGAVKEAISAVLVAIIRHLEEKIALLEVKVGEG